MVSVSHALVVLTVERLTVHRPEHLHQNLAAARRSGDPSSPTGGRPPPPTNTYLSAPLPVRACVPSREIWKWHLRASKKAMRRRWKRHRFLGVAQDVDPVSLFCFCFKSALLEGLTRPMQDKRKAKSCPRGLNHLSRPPRVTFPPISGSSVETRHKVSHVMASAVL
jgi:hypothetical protein